MGIAADTHLGAPRVAAPHRVRPRIYTGLSALMVGIVVVGFWPSYFGPMVRGNIERPAIIQIHGLVFVGWMALLMAQVALAARGRIQLHRKVGRYGVAYGWLVIAMGLVAGPAASVIHVRAGEWTRDRGAGFLLITFGDMVLFGACFAAAVAYRNRPEIHKRLMIAATVALLFAAVGRMDFIGSPPLASLVWLSPLFIGMVHDKVTRGRVHPVYIITTVGLFIGGTRTLFEQSEAWLRIARPLLDALL
ncbi:MAG TPA: hypothetical protein VGQ37_15920 [Vicinamibacterales bacterium]|jgi:hypothetical protein|nr:hypothetical protein [Vicinamibacterales bacterium]